MKKPDFKAAIDQIESALRGEDPAPNSYEVNFTFFCFLCLFIYFLNLSSKKYIFGFHDFMIILLFVYI